MNIHILHKPVLHFITMAMALWSTAAVIPAQAQQPDALKAQASWQTNRLFAPTGKQREQEKRGSIVIYDGLKDITINKIMDKAFDRIQNMMFIHIIHTNKHGHPQHDKNGNVVVDDDDC